MKITSLLLLGTLPPPIGGVTISVKNLKDALELNQVNVGVLYSGLMNRYQVAHSHAYSPMKRLILLVLGKLFASKNVFTIHGMHFDQKNFFNRIALELADGVVVLNDDILKLSPKLNKLPILKSSSLVKEGLNLANSSKKILSVEKPKPRLLLYAQHGNSFEGEPIYGVPFIEEVLGDIVKNFTLVFVDLNKCYPEFAQKSGVIYFGEVVDFNQLLREVDVYVRPTSKDGDAIAIHEAISNGIPVVASDVVSRPEGVKTYPYHDKKAFLQAIDTSITDQKSVAKLQLSSVTDYLNFYKSLFN